jgi:HSP20 family protein
MRRYIVRHQDWPGFGLMSDVLRSMAGTLNEMSGISPASPEHAWAPRVDVINGETEVIVKADVPGVKKEDLQVTATSGELTISGETKEELEEKKESYHRVERRWGRFSRTVDLPAEVNPAEVKAKLENGILEVRAPKLQPPEPDTHTVAVE